MRWGILLKKFYGLVVMIRDVKIIVAVIALFFTGAIESYSGDDAGIIMSFRDRDSLCLSGTLVDSRQNIKTTYLIAHKDNNPYIMIEKIYCSYSTIVNSELNYSSIIHNAASSILYNSDLITGSENSAPEIILYCPDNWSIEQVTPNPYQKNIILKFCQQCSNYTKLIAKMKSDEDVNEMMSVTHQAVIFENNEPQKSASNCTKINTFSAINDKSQNLLPEEPASNDPFWSLYGNNINSEEQFLGTSPESSSPMVFKTKGVERMRIEANGQIEISDNDPDNPPHAVPQTHTDYLLAVEGKILAQEIVVTPKN